MAGNQKDDVVLYHTKDRIAFITLNRPHAFNSLTPVMPAKVKEAIDRANQDSEVRVIVLQGAGNAFCTGYDLKIFAESPQPCLGTQSMPWDPFIDYQTLKGYVDNFMSIWRSLKPVICKIHGAGALGGGTDMALCSDFIIMDDDARIGFPAARVWGCPTTMFWVYRLGAEKAKRMLLTGDIISGKEAAQMGLVLKSVPSKDVDAEVMKLAERMVTIPANHLMMHKLVINQAYDNMGLNSTQILGTFFDGIARHSPEGLAFKERAEKIGFKAAVLERDRPNAKL